MIVYAESPVVIITIEPLSLLASSPTGRFDNSADPDRTSRRD
jgi:hypothetical protein